MSGFLRIVCRTVPFLVVFVALFVSKTEVRAQVITGWEVDPTLAENMGDIMNGFKSGTGGAALDNFFDKYYFARWTTPDNKGQVHVFARDFLTKDLQAATGNGREYFLTKSLATLKKMAADTSVTPMARYNAVMAIGLLFQREAPNRNSAPTAYAPALPYMLEEYKKEGNPDYIQLGLLLGILRHVHLGVADEETKNTTLPAFFLDIVQKNQPKQGSDRQTQELHDWFRYRAMEGLGALKTPGENGKILNALAVVIENNWESLEMRTKAARTIGELDYQNLVASGENIPFQRYGTLLISLVKSINDQEMQTVKGLIDKEKAMGGAAGGSGLSGLSDMGSGMGGSGSLLARGGSGGSGGLEGTPYANLTAEKRLEIDGSVQRLKSGLKDTVFGMRGDRIATGQTTVGIRPLLLDDDPVATKLDKTVRAISQLFKSIDEGPPEEAQSARTTGGSSLMEESSRSSSSSPRRGSAADKKDEKLLKVNLYDIRNALQDFGATLDGIISGAGA